MYFAPASDISPWQPPCDGYANDPSWSSFVYLPRCIVEMFSRSIYYELNRWCSRRNSFLGIVYLFVYQKGDSKRSNHLRRKAIEERLVVTGSCWSMKEFLTSWFSDFSPPRGIHQFKVLIFTFYSCTVSWPFEDLRPLTHAVPARYLIFYDFE